MIRTALLALFLSFSFLIPAKAVGIVTGGTNINNFTYSYNSTLSSLDMDVTHWSSTLAWGGSSTTGWSYVGQINGASGVYLGNGWVITAAHVGAGTFLLNGTNYSVISGSGRSITSGGNTVDLTLFKISGMPALPALTLSLAAPTTSVVMLGYGGDGGNETWGADNVTAINESITPTGTSYVSNDFLTLTEYPNSSFNLAQVIVGDSGGGDFVYNTSTGRWELAGINEVNGTATIGVTNYAFSGMVQLDTYAAEINSITEAPEPQTWVLTGLGLALVGFYSRRRRSA